MAIDFKQIALFADFPETFFEAMHACAVIKKFPAKSIITWEGDECQLVYFILEGWVELFRASRDGREQIIERLKEGEAFNLAPIFTTMPVQQATARALKPSILAVVSQKDFINLMDQFPQSYKALACHFARRLANMADSIETLSLYSVRGRLAKFLIDEADTSGDQRWTQEDMARRLGTVRDVIGRMLRQFEDDGLIRMARQRILLLDRERILDIAGVKK
jgi:CRP/FNR family cyclic AMP-dependent transcriptional regulator